jgi:CarD family transcriptional regulator
MRQDRSARLPPLSNSQISGPLIGGGNMRYLSMNGTEFNVGDKAVYPAHGVGVIEAIEKKVISGTEQTFYIMRILQNGMTILIPKENVENVGLRQVISEKEVKKIYEILGQKDLPRDNHQTWNRRYREYTEKLRTGSVYDIAEVLRVLFRLKRKKELSFGEKKILDTAQNLLVKEISVARNMREEHVQTELINLLSA